MRGSWVGEAGSGVAGGSTSVGRALAHSLLESYPNRKSDSALGNGDGLPRIIIDHVVIPPGHLHMFSREGLVGRAEQAAGDAAVFALVEFH